MDCNLKLEGILSFIKINKNYYLFSNDLLNQLGVCSNAVDDLSSVRLHVEEAFILPQDGFQVEASKTRSLPFTSFDP